MSKNFKNNVNRKIIKQKEKAFISAFVNSLPNEKDLKYFLIKNKKFRKNLFLWSEERAHKLLGNHNKEMIPKLKKAVFDNFHLKINRKELKSALFDISSDILRDLKHNDFKEYFRLISVKEPFTPFSVYSADFYQKKDFSFLERYLANYIKKNDFPNYQLINEVFFNFKKQEIEDIDTKRKI